MLPIQFFLLKLSPYKFSTFYEIAFIIFLCEEKSVVMCTHMCGKSSQHWLSLLPCFFPPSLCSLSLSFFLSLLLLSPSSAEWHYIPGLFQVFTYKIISWHSQHFTRIYCFHVTDGKYWAVLGRQVAAESWLGANPSVPKLLCWCLSNSIPRRWLLFLCCFDFILFTSSLGMIWIQ